MSNFDQVSSEKVLESARIGLWAIEVTEGERPRMYGDAVMLRLLGASEDMAPEDVFDFWQGNIDPDCIDITEDFISTLRMGSFAGVQYSYNHPTQGQIYVNCSGSRSGKIPGGYRFEGCHQDISTLIKVQHSQLTRSERIIAALTDDYEFMTYVALGGSTEFDSCLDYRKSGPLVDAIIGWDREMSLHDRMALLRKSVVYEEDQENFKRYIYKPYIDKIIDEQGRYYANFRVVLDGEIHYYQLAFAPVYEGTNRVGGVVGLKNADSAIKKELAAQTKLENALKDAQAASLAKSTFLSNMSHDIRTPMNAIIGFGEIARKHIDDKERVLDCLDKAQSASDHLMQLINDVLDLSRIESGHTKLEPAPIRIKDAAITLDSMIEPLAKAKGVLFQHFSNTPEDLYVMADILHVNQILINVINNAIKYTEPGGLVTMDVNTRILENGRVALTYTISDTGIGMSQDYLAHVFEQFSRERETSAGQQGTGLGMAIVKDLTELMGGHIDVQSKPGEGTTVTIDLEFDRSSVQAVAEAHRASEVHLDGMKALLVEDNALNREIAVDILSDEGITVEEAEDGLSAVNILRMKGPDYYNFVLMDIRMPVMNGYEATQAIRTMNGFQRLPIIALSANAYDADRQKSIECGMNAHIAKPISVPILIETLSRHI